MARKQTSSRLNQKQELIASLDRSRSRIAKDTSQLGDALNVTRKLEASFHTYRYWWIGGGLLTGLFLAKNLLTPLFPKSSSPDEKKSSPNESNALFGLIGIAGKQIIRMIRPVLKKAAEKEIEQWVANIYNSRQNDSDNHVGT